MPMLGSAALVPKGPRGSGQHAGPGSPAAPAKAAIRVGSRYTANRFHTLDRVPQEAVSCAVRVARGCHASWGASLLADSGALGWP